MKVVLSEVFPEKCGMNLGSGVGNAGTQARVYKFSWESSPMGSELLRGSRPHFLVVLARPQENWEVAANSNKKQFSGGQRHRFAEATIKPDSYSIHSIRILQLPF